MSRRDEFVRTVSTLRAASAAITPGIYRGLLRQAFQEFGLSIADAQQILRDAGFVVGDQVDYFRVLGISVSDLQGLSESAIGVEIDAAHEGLYRASLRAGGRVRPDGRTEDQWRAVLNRARDTLRDPKKRREHIAMFRTEAFQHSTLVGADEFSELEATASAPTNLDEMVLIPAGEFQMGGQDSEAGDDERPVHAVHLDLFSIDRYPVTNGQYKVFLEENPEWRKDSISEECHDGFYLSTWRENDYPRSEAQHPVVDVSWYGAMAYAAWVGKRLPTEAEWEKAARGGLEKQKYPWGDTITLQQANYADNVGSTTPVGSYAANAYGLYDMCGNGVWMGILQISMRCPRVGIRYLVRTVWIIFLRISGM